MYSFEYDDEESTDEEEAEEEAELETEAPQQGRRKRWRHGSTMGYNADAEDAGRRKRMKKIGDDEESTVFLINNCCGKLFKQ